MSTNPPAALPARSALGPTGLHVALVDIARDELGDPFLHETIKRVPATQSIVHVPSADLGRVPACAAPAGVIFHVSRCGSTLVSQLLKQHDDLAVYAEPLAINELLASPHAGTSSEKAAALRTLGAQFSAHARGPYVLKLSSWNLLHSRIVLEAFPQSPWTVCLRDPLEVCVSLFQTQPRWLHADNAAIFASAVGGDGVCGDVEQRIARFFAAFCEAASRLDLTRGLLLDYEALPAAVIDRLAPHFGLPLSEAGRLRMAATAQLHAKSRPGQPTHFAPDAQRKRDAASPALRQAVEAIARPAYQALQNRFSAR
jgi:hypothetical protein